MHHCVPRSLCIKPTQPIVYVGINHLHLTLHPPRVDMYKSTEAAGDGAHTLLPFSALYNGEHLLSVVQGDRFR